MADDTPDYEQWILELEKLIAEQQVEIIKLKERPLRGARAKKVIAAHTAMLDAKYGEGYFRTEATARIRELEQQVKDGHAGRPTDAECAGIIDDLEKHISEFEDEVFDLECRLARAERYIEALENGEASDGASTSSAPMHEQRPYFDPKTREAALDKRLAEYERLRKPRRKPKQPTQEQLDLGDDKVPY
jgi:hypothetical protein